MVNRAFNLLALVVGGIILANIVAPQNATSVANVINGGTKFWAVNTNALLGKPV